MQDLRNFIANFKQPASQEERILCAHLAAQFFDTCMDATLYGLSQHVDPDPGEAVEREKERKRTALIVSAHSCPGKYWRTEGKRKCSGKQLVTRGSPLKDGEMVCRNCYDSYARDVKKGVNYKNV